MKMKIIFSKITFQDVVQIIGIMSPFLLQFFKNKFYEKHLKCKREKSSLDKYLNYYIFWYFAGLIVIVMYIFLEAVYYAVKGITYSFNDADKKCLMLINIVIYFCVFIRINSEEDTIKLKKKYKYSKIIKDLLKNGPIVLSGIMYSLFFNGFIFVIRILGIMLIVLEVTSYFILDSNPIFEYKYVSFYLKDNTEIKEVKTEQVKFKGAWIIIKNKTMKNEVRFREQEVSKIEYSDRSSSIFII
ncbi:MAG: hypothetical protein NC086_11825 [Alistipes sp.]|nr:hypothetical protein [Alistipes sp.]